MDREDGVCTVSFSSFKFFETHLSVLPPWSHFQENLAEQQHTDGPALSLAVSTKYHGVSFPLLKLKLVTSSHRYTVSKPPGRSLVAVCFHFASFPRSPKKMFSKRSLSKRN